MPEYLIVMTASIQPAAGAQIARKDPKIRLQDYKAALRFWLAERHPKLHRILFLENSGSDLSELQAIARDENSLGKEVEFISMQRNQIPAGVNYGYGEMQMLDEGLKRSSLRQRTTHMVKVTGRLTFPGIARLMDKLPESFDACVECRIPTHSYKTANLWKVLKTHAGAYTTAQMMIFSHAFYEKELQKLYFLLQPEFPDSYPTLIENIIFDRLIQFEGQPGIYLRWPIEMEPAGQAGHRNKRYDDPKRAIVRAVRSAARTLAPRLWI